MIPAETIDKLKKQFSKLHPLIFRRSLERAKSVGELFDILDTFPNEYPVVWDENERTWKVTKDLFQSKNLSKKDEE
jgi:hypothetical protein